MVIMQLIRWPLSTCMHGMLVYLTDKQTQSFCGILSYMVLAFCVMDHRRPRSVLKQEILVALGCVGDVITQVTPRIAVI